MRRRRNIPESSVLGTQSEIQELCAQCRAEARFAFDTEFVMEDRYEAEVCLLQIAVGDTVAIVDPFKKLDLQPVWNLVGDPEIETIVHAGQEDLALSVQHTGAPPRNIFDVQIAAGFVGYDYPVSLQRLVQSTLHIRLHKSKTLTDWRKRPLSPEQIRYAAEDVSYLLEIRNLLDRRLGRLNRRNWAREEFARFEDIHLYKRAEDDKLLRLKGSGALKGRQLAALQRLAEWREALARRLNRPARVVLKDHLLVEIAKLGLKTFGEIRDLRGLTLRDTQVRDLCVVAQEAATIPQEQWPKAKARDVETPRETAAVALITAVIRGMCFDGNVAYGLVATQRTIRELVRHHSAQRPPDRKDVGLLNGWRGKFAGAVLDGVLTGRRHVRLTHVNGEYRVEAPGKEKKPVAPKED